MATTTIVNVSSIAFKATRVTRQNTNCRLLPTRTRLSDVKQIRLGYNSGWTRGRVDASQAMRASRAFVTTTMSSSVDEYPDPGYCKKVLDTVPGAGTCNVEEARVLCANGFTFLDVRGEPELDSEGKIIGVKGLVNVPLVNFRRYYDSEKRRKTIEKTANTEFMEKVQKLIPNKAQPVVVFCSGVNSQGEHRATSAANMLRKFGYECVVANIGGFVEWTLKFDNKLERRKIGYAITSGGTSMEQRANDAGVAVENLAKGQDMDAKIREQLVNYSPGNVYSD